MDVGGSEVQNLWQSLIASIDIELSLNIITLKSRLMR